MANPAEVDQEEYIEPQPITIEVQRPSQRLVVLTNTNSTINCQLHMYICSKAFLPLN